MYNSQLGSNIGTTLAGITGSLGSALAQLYYPTAVQLDSNDDMYILDTSNYRVLKWRVGDVFGTVVVNGRGSGSGLDRIGASYAIFIDLQNFIYVSEYSNHRVTRWNPSNNTAGQLVKLLFRFMNYVELNLFDLLFFITIR